jgi:hypothetical protein
MEGDKRTIINIPIWKEEEWKICGIPWSIAILKPIGPLQSPTLDIQKAQCKSHLEEA